MTRESPTGQIIKRVESEISQRLNIDGVDGPPCKTCKYWRPRIKTLSNGQFGGIVLCTNVSMHPDFSCHSWPDRERAP